MAGPNRKRQTPKTRLPILPSGRVPRAAGRAPLGSGPSLRDEDSIYTLRGYKAWAERVKAAWDAET